MKRPVCVIMVAHPLLSASALIEPMLRLNFVQSSGHPVGRSAMPLLDRLFEHPSGECRQVARQWTEAQAALRVEQLAARLNLGNKGLVIDSAHTYLGMCTRNTDKLLAAVESAQVAGQWERHEYPTENEAHSLEPNKEVTIEISRDVDPLLRDMETKLQAGRSWPCGESCEETVEVLLGHMIMEKYLLNIAGISASDTLEAIWRTEQLLMAQLYDDRSRVLTVIVDVSTTWLDNTTAAVHQRMLELNQKDAATDHCAYLRTLGGMLWEQTCDWLEKVAQLEQVLKIECTDDPRLPERNPDVLVPSGYAPMPLLPQICSAAIRDYFASSTKAWTKRIVDPKPVHASSGQLQVTYCYDRPMVLHVLLTSVANPWGIAVESWPDAYHRLFLVWYVESDYYRELVARPMPSRQDYQEIRSAPTSLLLRAESEI